MGKLKVLSPAGSLESFYSALNNGADEIYMGINAFNARAKAEQISEDELILAITKAHILGVQVFCTINTLVFDNELNDVASTIIKAINYGFDAFIVQDLAVVKILKEIKPDAVIHISTQMGIHNSFGAIMAKKLGAKRIVLSREASLEDIKAIKKAVPDMEIEYFVQGALCVAFSGNCYLSNRLLGKSGNRGQCAQLCRLKYSAKFSDKVMGCGYYLSPADLSLYNHLNKLKEAGVTSLKIEGRLRRASYVGVATAFYKKLTDELNKNDKDDSFLKLVNSADIENLKITYNRGNYLKDAYLFPNFDNIIYKLYQNHIGLEIGKVVDCQRFKTLYKVELKVNRDLSQNDGLKIFRDKKEIASLGVGNTQIINGKTYIYTNKKLQSGDVVNLIHSEKLELKVIGNERKCSIDFNAIFKVGEKAKLTATINGKTYQTESNEILVSANTSPLTLDNVKISLNKLNDTIFKVGNIDVTLDNVFMAKSSLNLLRRDLINKIMDSYVCKCNININIESVINKLKSNANETKTDMLSLSLSRELNDKSVAYFPNEFNSNLKFTLQEYLNKNDKVYLFLPPFISDSDLKYIFNLLCDLDKNKLVIIANNIGQMAFASYFETIAGDFCNVTNSISLNEYISLGASRVCLGYEFSNREFKPFNYNCKINNNTILCFLSHCPYKAVTNTTCKNCGFNDSLSYVGENGTVYYVNRYKVKRCYFYLSGK